MSSDTNNKTSIDEKSEFKLQADICQSLTHPFRLEVLQILKNGEKNVGQIQKITNRPQPFISQHLRVLREKKVVKCRRKFNEKYYSLSDPKIIEICKLISEVAQITQNKENL